MSKYEEEAQRLGKLVTEKNAAYGSSFEKTGDFLGLLYPSGLKPEQYRDALAIVRVFDKMMRIANKKDAFGESPWNDIAGYGLLMSAEERVDNLGNRCGTCNGNLSEREPGCFVCTSPDCIIGRGNIIDAAPRLPGCSVNEATLASKKCAACGMETQRFDIGHYRCMNSSCIIGRRNIADVAKKSGTILRSCPTCGTAMTEPRPRFWQCTNCKTEVAK
jgi:hypothetical protein